jgi:hypothetical protein
MRPTTAIRRSDRPAPAVSKETSRAMGEQYQKSSRSIVDVDAVGDCGYG